MDSTAGFAVDRSMIMPSCLVPSSLAITIFSADSDGFYARFDTQRKHRDFGQTVQEAEEVCPGLGSMHVLRPALNQEYGELVPNSLTACRTCECE